MEHKQGYILSPFKSILSRRVEAITTISTMVEGPGQLRITMAKKEMGKIG